ncbi:MAG: hypothetical protein K2L82_01990 [Lachnospiraceae bacterium]|nr:hypothetical protein [Lachnospiraceae bacterium]
MLFIQHNLIAQNANRQLNVTTGKNIKTTEKLSSGYRINRAADDAAGLAISEKMRRQIRGLTQGTANARDGVSYVQVADGAMDEGHAILHRMNELALKSLNGTHTESDRAALNAEFDQLRTEIDRINSDTEFNEQKVFEEHESSYYQIEGCRRWNDNQLHTVPAAANELKINLPDSYVPNEYILTVPAGVYTTQELIDEIDDALAAMAPPNPGFVFEYTDKGYCNLNFERADGMPTKIASVEGSLAYLLYDLYGGSSSGDLLGTSVFETSHPFTIYKGQNDELIFYIESVNGSERVAMTIPPGEYTRSEMIDRINKELAKYPNTAGVTAKEYGDSYIQVTGGKGVSINGLKGNMFKYESATSKYSSVFYDNVQYGVSGGKNATITGAAFSYGSTTTDIDIKTGVNDTLSFKLNDRAGDIEVKIPAGKYTISEIATFLKNRFSEMGISKEITAEASYTSLSPYGYRLIVSSTMKGSKSLLEFNTTQAVHANTYNSLFRITNYNLQRSTGRKASFVGSAYHTGKINLSGDASLTFDVDGKSYTVDGMGGTYDNINSLITTLNNKLTTNYPDLKDKVIFGSSSNRLMIEAQNNDINQINFTQKNNTYKQLFENLYVDMSYTYTMGSIKYQQGSSVTEEQNATITVGIPTDKQSGPITIDKDSCTMSFSSNTSSTGTITLTAKTYGNIQELVNEINNKLKSNSNNALKAMQASYSGGKLIFTSPPRADSYRLYLENYTSTSSAWKNIFGVRYNVNGPSSYKAGKATLTTYSAVAESTTIDSTNNTLTLDIGKGDVTINIAPGSYASRDALKNAVQSAINGNSDLKDKVDVSITNDNKLQLSFAAGSAVEAKGSFHDEVLISKVTRNVSNYVKDGSYSDTDYTKAFIIGRKDLTGEAVEIVSDANDEFSFDFTFKSTSSFASSYEIPMDVKIPAGVYKGDELAKILQEKIQEKFTENGLTDFVIKVTIGGENTHVANSNDDTALQIAVNRKAGTEPAAGEYILDGVRGSAASFIFYKTTTEPRTTYITGTKDLLGGISFQPGQNVLTLSADSKPYQYTFPEGVTYTAGGFAELLNDMFENGDDNGNAAPLKASIENGVLRITHKVMGSHTITDIGGSARNTIFYNESGRDSRKLLTVLVSGEAGDHIEIPRVSVGSCAIKINSITISRPKYAEKAVRRIKEAIDLLSSKRSIYGAIQNRLEHTINNNNNIIENTQVSESAIRDADIADLMMEHSVNHILMQAGTSMLTQANQSNRLILELLR